MGTVALVMGIIGLILAIFPGTPYFAILALILGLVAMYGDKTGMDEVLKTSEIKKGKTAVILSVIGICIWIIWVIILAILLSM